MPDVSTLEMDRHNQQALEELCRLLRFSQGEFELILAVCNSSRQRQGLVQQLRQQCSVAFAEITLESSTTTLFTTIRSAIGSPPPEALMVYGLDGVHDQRHLLTATNQIREEFRQFPFPLVLWLTDDNLKQLIRTAPDFYTWANSVTFATPPEFFLAFLNELIADVWQQVVESRENRFLSNQELGLTPGSARCRELETSLEVLAVQGMALTPEQSAGLAFVQGRIADNNTPTAREHYEHSLAQWQALVEQNPGAEAVAQWQEKIGHGQFYLGLWWRNYSVRHRREFESACQQACRYFEQAVQTFESAQRPDFVARYINYWAEALHRLEAWDDLETVAARARLLHQAQVDPIRQARAEGFLAEVDLAHKNNIEAQRHAEAALALIQPLADSSAATSTADRDFYAWVNSFHRSWYVFSLGKAQMGQGQVDAAVQTLEQVQRITQPEYDPLLYSQTLEYLRQGYFEQGHYLQAFETRREKEAIESRFNFRAFVGAGRLQPKQQITNPALPTGDRGPDLIMASGRRQDVSRLITRLEQDEFVLTVVYGPSGVGKSSLIEAGLVPTLEQQRFGGRQVVPVRLRSYGNWVEEVLGAMPRPAALAEPAGEKVADLETLLLNLLRQQTQVNRVIILIFDQFEEFFFACDQPAERLRFYNFLRDCLTMPFIKVVLSLREDYTHYLLECNRLTDLAIIDNNILDKKWLYYLGNFSPDDARGVINDLTHLTPYAPASDLVERVVADLAAEAGEVRPIELQIVGSQLQAEGIATLADYQGWLHTGANIKAALVQQYLNDVVRDCGPVAHQQLANLVLYLLTDDKGTRPRKTRSELANELQALTAQAAMDVAPFGLVLQVLTESGLVVQLPEAPEDRYQLVHDYLAAFIHHQQQPQLEALLAELEEEKRQRRRLEQQKAELAESNENLGANLALMRAEQDDLQQKNRRARRVLAGTVVAAAAVAALAGGTAITSTLQARSARAQTIEIQGKATKKEKEADLNVMRAVYQVGMATLQEGVADRRAVQREAEAQQEVEAALAQLSDIDQRAKQEQQVAQAAIRNAEAQVAAAKVASVQAKADLAVAQEARAIALMEQERARYEATLVRRVTTLERAGITAAQTFRFRETETLLAAFKATNEVNTFIRTEGLAYLAYNPLLALQTSLNQIRETRLTGHEGYIGQVVFSPDGTQIATSGVDGTARLWDLVGNQVALMEGHQGSVGQVVFSPDGTQIATSGVDGTARLWDLAGNQVALMKGHEGYIGQVVFSPDGTQIATSGDDGTARLWDLSGNQVALMKGHEGYIGQVVFSPDGTQIATSGDDGTARLWDLSGNQVALMKGHEGYVGQVVFSPDGTQIATSGDDGTARLWDLQGNEITSIVGVSSISLSPLQDYIVLANGSGSVRLLTWSDMRTFRSDILLTEAKELTNEFNVFPNRGTYFSTHTFEGKKDQVISVSLKSDDFDTYLYLVDAEGNVLTSDDDSGFNSNSLLVYSLPADGSYQIVATTYVEGAIGSYEIAINIENTSTVLTGHKGPVWQVVFSPDETQIATSGADGTARLWDLSGNQMALMKGHQGSVGQVVFSSDGTQIATGGADGTARLWDLSGNQVALMEGHQGSVGQVVFSSDGTQIATHGADGTARLWDLSGNQVALMEGHQGSVEQVVFSPDGTQIATRGNDGTARLWDLSGNQVALMEGHQGSVGQLVFSPDGTQIATRGDDGTARLWDLSGNQVALMKGHEGYIGQVVFSPDGAQIATGGADGTARLWDLSGNQVALMEGHQRGVWQVVFSPDGTQIVTSGVDGTVRLWDLSGNQVALIEGRQGSVGQVVFSPDGTQIATGGTDGTARLWDLSGNQVALMKGHEGYVGQVVFSADGMQIATGGTDGTARLWDLSGNQVALMKGHEGYVGQVVFSPDGTQIATSGDDGTARLWDLSGTQVALMEGHQGSVGQVVFSPDGTQIATSGDDGTSRIWASNGQQIAQYEGYSTLRDDWRYIAVALEADRLRDKGVVKLWPVYTLDRIDELLAAACQRLTPYLTHNPDISNEDRALCGIPPREDE
ncbi:hypothetical protein H6F75_09585 [Nodosilinea sp. FACHB-131]|uniref:nSTAND1 domain-containing NTPase n=1 Tax=Cyanophyceae TaxID=3028117 RepID=UPI0016852E04|nr:hypothetical protein [Nodosilinea sp. FACHB-131]MBD1873733.1 hypothetical protein [Nodosilinea sp. FACHB-131]